MPEPPEDVLWLYGVARNVLANAGRSARRFERLRARLAAEPAPAAAETTSELGDVAPVLRRLPAPDAELLCLLAWEGLSHAEAAVVFDSTRRTPSRFGPAGHGARSARSDRPDPRADIGR